MHKVVGPVFYRIFVFQILILIFISLNRGTLSLAGIGTLSLMGMRGIDIYKSYGRRSTRAGAGARVGAKTESESEIENASGSENESGSESESWSENERGEGEREVGGEGDGERELGGEGEERRGGGEGVRERGGGCLRRLSSSKTRISIPIPRRRRRRGGGPIPSKRSGCSCLFFLVQKDLVPRDCFDFLYPLVRRRFSFNSAEGYFSLKNSLNRSSSFSCSGLP